MADRAIELLEEQRESEWKRKAQEIVAAVRALNVAQYGDGTIVRFTKDPVHPESLPLEAADVLRKVIEGKTSEVVDRALEDLLGGGGPGSALE